MKLRKILSSTNGLTLVEVLLSLTILGIIMIGIMQFFTQAYSFTNSNQNKTTAINVARNAMIYIEKQSFIETKKNLEDYPADVISLLICNDEYKLVRNSDTTITGCNPIKINNVDYDVTIAFKEDVTDESFMIPLVVKVNWEVNKKQYSTELEGAIKSEDIR